ncbi:MAG: MiaB/RimO family radical SAM methylthiotransferase, partial [Deltaproteobacteria bacterium]|nr:MiaB/RimO family radical SAM methylthiotransferase [Deltaproteobacteria bacterium]
LDLARQKEEGGCKKLVITGCLSQRYQGELPKELPEVDLFIGTNDYAEIGRVLSRVPPTRTHKFRAGGRPARPLCPFGTSPPTSGGVPLATRPVDLPSREYIHPPLYVHTSETPRLLATQPHTAYVKIAEGCSHTCSFCIIPKLRGKQRSRPVDDIITEVRNLKGMGVKEFNLIAQDTTDYGSDLHNGTTIEKLFSELAKIPGDHWLRLMYAYPLRFSDELIEIIASSPNFCRYVDIPFQHINGRILKSMHRGSDGRTIRGLVERMRERIPGIAIRSTFIVGYPGETEAEFQELAGFLKEAKLERVGVFTYSDEEGTEAAKLVDRVPEKIKKERRKILMEEQC